MKLTKQQQLSKENNALRFFYCGALTFEFVGTRLVNGHAHHTIKCPYSENSALIDAYDKGKIKTVEDYKKYYNTRWTRYIVRSEKEVMAQIRKYEYQNKHLL